jgi:hypothetical protein
MPKATFVAVIANFTDTEIKLSNLENTNEETCAALSADTAYKMTFPWAETENDYNNNRKFVVSKIIGSVFAPVYWLWERNGKVYISAKDDWKNGELVSGDSDGGTWWKILNFTNAPSTGGYSISLKNIKDIE